MVLVEKEDGRAYERELCADDTRARSANTQRKIFCNGCYVPSACVNGENHSIPQRALNMSRTHR